MSQIGFPVIMVAVFQGAIAEGVWQSAVPLLQTTYPPGNGSSLIKRRNRARTASLLLCCGLLELTKAVLYKTEPTGLLGASTSPPPQ